MLISGSFALKSRRMVNLRKQIILKLIKIFLNIFLHKKVLSVCLAYFRGFCFKNEENGRFEETNVLKVD